MSSGPDKLHYSFGGNPVPTVAGLLQGDTCEWCGRSDGDSAADVQRLAEFLRVMIAFIDGPKFRNGVSSRWIETHFCEDKTQRFMAVQHYLRPELSLDVMAERCRCSTRTLRRLVAKFDKLVPPEFRHQYRTRKQNL